MCKEHASGKPWAPKIVKCIISQRMMHVWQTGGGGDGIVRFGGTRGAY